jgi:phosphoglycerol transferase MdoB-like AlkP superfamily enzyme
MKQRFYFYLKYFFFWLVIQAFFRLIFIVFYHHLASDINLPDKLIIFWKGLKMDLSLTGYLLILPTLVIAITSFLKKNIARQILQWYTLVMLIPLILIYVTNLVTYQYWSFPIDKNIFDYVSTPAEMTASLETGQFILLLLFCAVLVFVFWYLFYKKWVASRFIDLKYSPASFIAFLCVTGLLILPIRGGLSISPLHTGTVYFHKNEFANHAAINPVWNLLYTLSEGERYDFELNLLPEGEVKSILADLNPDTSGGTSLLRTNRPNIVIIILESFGGLVIEELGGTPGLTPELSRFIPDGLFFTNFYANGTLTDKGISAVLSGIPSLPRTCIIHFEKKSQSLPFISRDLSGIGYNTTFLYGGNINFAHIKSYLIMGGFQKIISEDEFPGSVNICKWGVPDEYVFQRLLDECNRAEEPFFHVFMTLSSHSPFDVPMDPVYPGNSTTEKFYNSLYYTDKHLGEFLNNASTLDWWDNTLVILLSDHGNRLGNINEYDRSRFHIPMLWLGGALTEKGRVIDHYGSQSDLPKTILGQLGISSGNYDFGKDILDPNTPSYASYSFHNGSGFVTDTSYFVYHFPTERFVVEEGAQDPYGKNACKAFLQGIFMDFNQR